MKCSMCGAELNAGIPFCEGCGQPIPKSQQTQVKTSPAYFPKTGMYDLKWYKFLIYFVLFFSAAVNLIVGIGMLSSANMEYSEEAASLRTIFGWISIAYAGVAFLTRFRLSGFHKDGPILVVCLYASSIVIEFLSAMLIKNALPYYLASQVSVSVPAVAVSAAMAIANAVYFNKRKELFED